MKHILTIALSAGALVSSVNAASLNATTSAAAITQKVVAYVSQAHPPRMQKIAAGVPANEFAESLVFEIPPPPVEINSSTGYEWLTSAWSPYSRTSYTRNGDGLITETVSQYTVTSSNTWENQERKTITYTNQHLTMAVMQEWDADSSAWTDISKFEFTYSGDTIKNLSGSFFMGTWFPIFSGSFYYSPTVAGQLDSMIMTISFLETTQSKIALTYQANGQIGQTMGYERAGTSGAWIETSRSTFTYSGTPVTQVEVSEELDTTANALIRVDSIITVKNANDDPVTETTYSWNSRWEEYAKDTYTYSGKIPADMISQLWSSSAWENSMRVAYSSESVGTVLRKAVANHVPLSAEIVQSGKESVSILVSTILPANLSIRLYSLSGKLVAVPVKNHPQGGEGKYILDTKALSGTYICSVVSQYGTVNKLISAR